MGQHIFITGIGTGVGKTMVSAIVAEALQADYWKPVQAGYQEGTDAGWVHDMLSNDSSKVYPELYKLRLAASPHIAAREQGITIDLSALKSRLQQINAGLPAPGSRLIIEGAGGLLVPLNENEFVANFIKQINAKVILVSRNYLGSINHSLLTASVCRQYQLNVAGWVFNDQYLSYEDEIVNWSGFPKIASIPFEETPGKKFIATQAALIRKNLEKFV